MRRFVVIATVLLLAGQLAAPARAADGWTAGRFVPGARSGFPFPVTVALGADGTGAVVWRDRGAFPAKARVRVAVLERTGRWARTTTLGSRGVAGPAVAVDGRGRVLVTWVQMRPRGLVTHGPYRIRLATRSARGDWNVRTLGRASHFIGSAPAIAAGARGDAVVAWRGARVADGQRIEATVAAYRRADKRFGAPRALRDESGTGARAQARAAIDGRGGAHVAWVAQVGARTGLWTADRERTGAWSRGHLLDAGPATAPAVAATPAGDLVVAWRRAELDSEGNGVQSGTVAVATRPTGGSFGAPRLYAASQAPRVVADADGAVLVAWEPPSYDTPYTRELHYAAGSIDAGTGPEQVVPGAGVETLAALRSGFVLAAADVGGVDVRELAGGGLRGPFRVGHVGSSAVAAASGRRGLVVWFHQNRLLFTTRGTG